MRYFWELSRTGLTSLLLHPLRSIVTILCLVIALTPYLAGLGLSLGLRQQLEASVAFGADLYVGGEQFGRPISIPFRIGKEIAQIPGVTQVTPRIVGRLELGKDHTPAIVVGVPLEQFPPTMECIQGRLFRGGNRNELVMGTDLAQNLHLEVGAFIPPFYRNRKGEQISEVVGIFRSDIPLWQSRLILTSLETAQRIFDQSELITDFMVRCQPGYTEEVQIALLRTVPFSSDLSIRSRITTREELTQSLPQKISHREGFFTFLFVLAFVVGILVVLVTSGFGSTERRREIAILKATGWQTDQLLWRSLVGSFLSSLVGASLSIICAFVWLKSFNGIWLAGAFIPEIGVVPSFQIPFRLTPIPTLLAFLLAWVIVTIGSLYSTWRTAITPPWKAMR